MWQKINKDCHRSAGRHVEAVVTRCTRNASFWYWEILHNGKTLRKAARSTRIFLSEAQNQAETLIAHFDDQIDKSQAIDTAVRRKKMAAQVMSRIREP